MRLIASVLLFCSVTYVYSSDLCSVCGTVPLLAPIQPRIFDGRTASIAPWMVFLEFTHKNGSQHICSGTIIDYQYVLTAAHCFLINQLDTPQKKAKITMVWAGNVLKRGPASKGLRVEAVHLHPKFDYPGGVNSFDDLAIVKLKKPIEISPKIRPICLGNVNFKANDDGLLQGYGMVNKIRRNRTCLAVSDKLMEADLKIESDEKCKQTYKDMYTPDHLCALNRQRTSIGGCPGDSGGPLVVLYEGRYYQIGVTSFGGHCDEFPNQALVFTRVSSYLDWIRNITNNADDCSPVAKAVRNIIH